MSHPRASRKAKGQRRCAASFLFAEKFERLRYGIMEETEERRMQMKRGERIYAYIREKSESWPGDRFRGRIGFDAQEIAEALNAE